MPSSRIYLRNHRGHFTLLASFHLAIDEQACAGMYLPWPAADTDCCVHGGAHCGRRESVSAFDSTARGDVEYVEAKLDNCRGFDSELIFCPFGSAEDIPLRGPVIVLRIPSPDREGDQRDSVVSSPTCSKCNGFRIRCAGFRSEPITTNVPMEEEKRQFNLRTAM